MRKREGNKVYLWEFGASMAIYALILVAAARLDPLVPAGLWRTVVGVSPMIGYGLMTWAVARHFRRIDEYIRQLQLECIAVAAAVTSGLSFTYGFLEGSGYPRLSMFVVMPVLFGLWGALLCIRTWRGR
jgi:hypothetical protein